MSLKWLFKFLNLDYPVKNISFFFTFPWVVRQTFLVFGLDKAKLSTLFSILFFKFYLLDIKAKVIKGNFSSGIKLSTMRLLWRVSQRREKQALLQDTTSVECCTILEEWYLTAVFWITIQPIRTCMKLILQVSGSEATVLDKQQRNETEWSISRELHS